MFCCCLCSKYKETQFDSFSQLVSAYDLQGMELVFNLDFSCFVPKRDKGQLLN